MIVIMSDQFLPYLEPLLKTHKKLAPDEVLFRVGDRIRSMFVVVVGEVRLVRSLPHGAQLTLQRAAAREILAEASLFQSAYHCDAIAAVSSEVAIVPRRTLLDNLHSNPEFAAAFCAHLAREVQWTRAHAEILSLKTVSERLDAWLALNGERLPAKGQGRRIASEINVSPEALYREIARRAV